MGKLNSNNQLRLEVIPRYSIQLFLVLLIFISDMSIGTLLYGQNKEVEISEVRTFENWRKEDFKFLDSIAGKKRIIFIGEKNHNDGTTLSLKNELIKYLHDKFSYDVLLLEYGQYESFLAGQDIIEKKDSAVGVLSRLKYIYGVMIGQHDLDFGRYLDTQMLKKSPLKIGGFDIVSGSSFQDNFVLDLENLLNNLKRKKDIYSYDSDFVTFSFKGSYRHFSSTEEYQNWLAKKNLPSIQLAARNLINYIDSSVYRLAAQDKILYAHFLMRCLESELGYIHYSLDLKNNLHENGVSKLNFNNERDSLMAENLIWLFKNYFQGKKIIVSCSNMHLSKFVGKEFSKISEFNNYKPMYEYLYEKLSHDSIYSICMISGEGTRGKPGFYSNNSLEVLPKILPGSLEAALFAKGNRFSFVKSESIKQQQYFLSPIFDKYYFGNWRNIYDSYIFIKNMTPVSIRMLKGRAGKKPPYQLPNSWFEENK